MTIMVKFIADLPKTYGFNTPGTTDIKQRIFAKFDGTTKRLSDGQLVALTLNEICAKNSRGEISWTPTELIDVYFDS